MFAEPDCRRDVVSLINGLSNRKDILEAIKGYTYEDLTEESGFLNIHIPTKDGGYIRIYRPYDRQKELVPDKEKIRIDKYMPVFLRRPWDSDKGYVEKKD